MARDPNNPFRLTVEDQLAAPFTQDLLDPKWVEWIIGETHAHVQQIRRRDGLPEWDFSAKATKAREDKKCAERKPRLSHPGPRGVNRHPAFVASAELGARIREKRRAENLSLYSCSVRIGLTDNLLGAIEKGREPRIRKRTMNLILQWLGDPVVP